jgi:hypothetical protein
MLSCLCTSTLEIAVVEKRFAITVALVVVVVIYVTQHSPLALDAVLATAACASFTTAVALGAAALGAAAACNHNT